MTARRARISLPPTAILGHRKDGRAIHPIAGGSADGDQAPPAEPQGGDAGSGGGDPTPPAKPPVDLEAEVAKWKELSRKNESRASANAEAAKELAALKAANQTDNEKAIAEAEQRGRSAATAEVAQKLAAAEVRAALTGVVPDPAAIVEDLNLAKYVTETGDVNQEAVTALRTKYASMVPVKPPTPDLKQGDQGGGVKKDLDAQIAEATAAGKTALAMALTNQKLQALRKA